MKRASRGKLITQARTTSIFSKCFLAHQNRRNDIMDKSKRPERHRLSAYTASTSAEEYFEDMSSPGGYRARSSIVAAIEKNNSRFRGRDVRSGRPGELLCQDMCYVGHLKGVGKMYLQTMVDTYGSYAFGYFDFGLTRAKRPIDTVDERLTIVRKDRLTGFSSMFQSIAILHLGKRTCHECSK